MKDEKSEHGESGFTLIELMIVVAIIGILAAIAVPKFAGLLRKSNEGASKGHLGAIRSALTIYYGDLEGQYPSDLAALTLGGRYLSQLVAAKAPTYHADSAAILNAVVADDAGGWAYNNATGDQNLGAIVVNCTHTDSKGNVWTSY